MFSLGAGCPWEGLARCDFIGGWLHYWVGRAERVGRDDVNVGQGEGFRHRFAARDQELFVFRRCRRRSGRYGHVLAPLHGLVLRVLARDPRREIGRASCRAGGWLSVGNRSVWNSRWPSSPSPPSYSTL